MAPSDIKNFLSCQDQYTWEHSKKTGNRRLGQRFNKAWVSNGLPLPFTVGDAAGDGQAGVAVRAQGDVEAGAVDVNVGAGAQDADEGGLVGGAGGAHRQVEAGAGIVNVVGSPGHDERAGPSAAEGAEQAPEQVAAGNVDVNVGGGGSRHDEGAAAVDVGGVAGGDHEGALGSIHTMVWPLSEPDLGQVHGFGQHEFTLVTTSANKAKAFHCKSCNLDMAPSGILKHFSGEAHGVPKQVIANWSSNKDYNSDRYSGKNSSKIGPNWKKADKSMKKSTAGPIPSCTSLTSSIAVPKPSEPTQPKASIASSSASRVPPLLKLAPKARPSPKAATPPVATQPASLAPTNDSKPPADSDWKGKEYGFGYKEIDTFHFSGKAGVLLCQMCHAKGKGAKEVNIKSVYTHINSHGINLRAFCKGWLCLQDYYTSKNDKVVGTSFEEAWQHYAADEVTYCSPHDGDVDDDGGDGGQEEEGDVDMDAEATISSAHYAEESEWKGQLWVGFSVDKFVTAWTDEEGWDDQKQTHRWPPQMKAKVQQQGLDLRKFKVFLRGSKQNKGNSADGTAQGVRYLFACLDMDPPGPHNPLDLVCSLNKQSEILDELAACPFVSTSKYWTGKMLRGIQHLGKHLLRECNKDVYAHTDYIQNINGLMYWCQDMMKTHLVQIKGRKHKMKREQEFKISKYASKEEHRAAVEDTFNNFKAFAWALNNPTQVEKLGLAGPDWLYACEVEVWGGVQSSTYAGRPGPWQEAERMTIMRMYDVDDDKVVFTKHKNGIAIGEVAIWMSSACKQMLKEFDSLLPSTRTLFWNKIMAANQNTSKWCKLHYPPGATIRTATLDRKKMESDTGDCAEDTPATALITAQNILSSASAQVGHHGDRLAKDVYDTKQARHLASKCRILWQSFYGDPVEWPGQESEGKMIERLQVNYRAYRHVRGQAKGSSGSGSGQLLSKEARTAQQVEQLMNLFDGVDDTGDAAPDASGEGDREAVEEVQREETAEEAGYGVGQGDVTPPVPSQFQVQSNTGCANMDVCYRSMEAAVRRFDVEAAATEGNHIDEGSEVGQEGGPQGRSLEQDLEQMMDDDNMGTHGDDVGAEAEGHFEAPGDEMQFEALGEEMHYEEPGGEMHFGAPGQEPPTTAWELRPGPAVDIDVDIDVDASAEPPQKKPRAGPQTLWERLVEKAERDYPSGI